MYGLSQCVYLAVGWWRLAVVGGLLLSGAILPTVSAAQGRGELSCEPFAAGPFVQHDAWLHVVRLTLREADAYAWPEIWMEIAVRPAGKADVEPLRIRVKRTVRSRRTGPNNEYVFELGFFSGAGDYDVVAVLDDQRGGGCRRRLTVSTNRALLPAPAEPALAAGEMRNVAAFLEEVEADGEPAGKLPNGLRVLYLVNIDRAQRWQVGWHGAERFAAPVAEALAWHPAVAEMALSVFSMEDQRQISSSPFAVRPDLTVLYEEDYGIEPGKVDVSTLSTATEFDFLAGLLAREAEKLREADLVIVASPYVPWRLADPEPLAALFRPAGKDRLFFIDAATGRERSRKHRDGLVQGIRAAGGAELSLVVMDTALMTSRIAFRVPNTRLRAQLDKMLRKAYERPRKNGSTGGGGQR